MSLLDASRTLGAGPARTFFRIALPLAGKGLAAGAALSFARGIGEFGATIMFAGSLQGVTQTLSLAIYAQFDLNFDVALALGALLVLVSAAILLLGQAPPRVDTLDLDFSLPLRSFRLELALAVGRETFALVGPLRRRQDERPASGRRTPPTRAREDRARRARPLRRRRRRSTARPKSDASASSSRSTPSSRT